jgi:hypothetical protein
MQTEELVEEIAALEHHLAEAEQAGNPTALHHLIAADYAGISAQGQRVDRDEFIDAFLSPSLLIESLVLENLSVRIFEHVAIATGVSQVRGFLRQQPFRGRYHFTDIWVRRLMHWEIVAGHVSAAA